MPRPWTSASPDLEPGQKLGPYQLEEVLGAGGMGIVFRARREPDGATVALKLLRSELAADELYRRRFAREASVAQQVRHTHLVPVLEAGELEGRQYVTTSYLPGGTLDDRLRAQGPLPLADVTHIAAQVAAGLTALHEHGLVHRDVKPSNILLDERGAAALTDFGLARGRAHTVLTSAGQVIGTLDYLAPELIKGEPAGAASDIYALGCVVFESIRGRPPFAGVSALEVGLAHLEREPPDLREGRDDVPADFAWAALQALAKDPAERPPTAAVYAHTLAIAARATR